jgi:hypothetical protein
MTFADLGNIGEFVASIVVVVSLIHLATQVRQNSRLLRASAIQSASSNTASGFVSVLANSLDVSSFAVKGLGDFDSLSPQESAQFSSLLFLIFNEVQGAYLLNLEDALPESLWKSRVSIIAFYLRTPGGREAWRMWRELLDRGFVSYIEHELLREPAEG